jgi:heterodisulfide reductase subunit A2
MTQTIGFPRLGINGDPLVPLDAHSSTGNAVLVIGGGVAGVQAALDLAESGARVVLVERGPSLGGKMAALDKNFPTLDCSICIEAPKLAEVSEHPQIEVLANAEIVGLEGDTGAFRARIRQRTSFVTNACTRCDLCVAACPVLLPSEFDAAMASRKAIYTPFAQAVPSPYVVDPSFCLNQPPNFLPCGRCLGACAPQAIDFSLPGQQSLVRDVSAVVVATGFDLIDPGLLSEYGYGRHPDVLTSLEFERLLTSAGPTGGEIVRPSDGRHPHKIAFVLCVGSRDRRFFRYCSRFCCMYSMKHAFQALDHGVPDVLVLYMDIRAYGKGFDAFWERTRQQGARFVRSRPAQITPLPDGGIRLRYEDTEQSRLVEEDVDMVVLATAVQAPSGLDGLASTLGVALGADGFIATAGSVSVSAGVDVPVPANGQAKSKSDGVFASAPSVATTRPGVYACGCATGPKDIPDSVAEASAAAAAALTHVRQRHWAVEETPGAPADDTPRIGVFVCDCGSNIAGTVDVPAVVRFAGELPDVVHAEEVMFACAGNTQQAIADTIRTKGINRLVVSACSPKTHEGTFRRTCVKAGLNPYLLEMVNLRNQDSWVHKGQPEAATLKAMDMVEMGVRKASLLQPLSKMEQPVQQSALVVGGGIAGMTAAANLARQGYQTHLIEREPELGGQLRFLDRLAPAGIDARTLIEAHQRDVEQAGVVVYAGTEVEVIGGHVGSYHARLSSGEELHVGAVVLATGAQPYRPDEFGYGAQPNVVTNVELEALLPNPPGERITFVSCIGARTGELGCSRYCCTSMIHQAMRLRQAGKTVRVLYKDIRTFGREAEELYEAAMRAGVQFIRFDAEAAPADAVRFEDGRVTVRDALLGAVVQFPTDLLVLVVGLVPASNGLAKQLKVASSTDGFLLERHPKLGPAEASSPGIYLAGTAQAPKDVRDSATQALAAAGKASALLARDTIGKEPLTAQVIQEKCTGCSLCALFCPFSAIEMVAPGGMVLPPGVPRKGEPKGIARVIAAACEGCGVCASACNFDAIEMPSFTDAQVMAQIDAALTKRPEEKVVVFACNWCSYAGADQAGIEKIQYPTSARIIRTMCSGRLSEEFIARAFDDGAGAVLVTGCRIGDCHYLTANHQTAKRFEVWRKKFARQGIEPDRLQLQWISAAEGKEFAAKMHEIDGVVRAYAAAAGQTLEEPGHDTNASGNGRATSAVIVPGRSKVT